MHASTSKVSNLLLLIAIISQRTLSNALRPSFVNSIALKVKGDEECVRTSQYAKPQSGYVCKDLGQCYQYRCGAIARYCSECGAYKGPCIDYSQDGENSNSNERSRRDITDDIMTSSDVNSSTSSIAAFMTQLTSRMRLIVERVRAVVGTVPSPQTIRIETIGNSIVHLRAGLKNCTGFLVSVRGPKRKNYLILTAAQCLINFRTECYSGLEKFGSKFRADEASGKMVDGFTMYQYNDTWPCFGDYDADVTKVKKGFRSYVVVITSYMGRNFTIPLDSQHVIVPSSYMECQDCRRDFAAIKINNQMANAILRGHDPFILSPNRDPMEWTGEEVPQFVTVKENHAPHLLRKASDTKFCTVNYATNEKMCFRLPIPPNMNENPELLPGSPLFLPEKNNAGQTEYHCIGVFTGTYGTVKENLSTEKLMEDGLKPPPEGTNISLDMMYSKNGAVRITDKMADFLKKLCGEALMNETRGNESRIVPQVFPPRRDCFPSLKSPYNSSEHLFLCSLGWKNEGSGCIHPDVKLSHGCEWDGVKFRCDPRIRRNEWITGDPQASIFQEITIPGTTKYLSLRGHRISNEQELSTALTNLPMLQDLILDYNEIELLEPPMFANNSELRMISLKHNNIRRIHSAIFRFNKKLRHLNLAHNQIKILPVQLLHRVTILQYLNLEDNNINFVTPKFFNKNEQLERIHLGSNNISYFAQKLLKNQGRLKEFWIDRNNVKRLTKFAFRLNPLLTLVDVSHNLLTAIPRNIFDHNRELRFVNLDHNVFPFFPLRLFEMQKKLVSVTASSNPLLSPNKTRLYFEATGVPYT